MASDVFAPTPFKETPFSWVADGLMEERDTELISPNNEGPSFKVEGKKVWVAGHTGMVGSAMARELSTRYCQVLTVSRDDLDLRRQSDVEAWMEDAKPDAVVLAAATVGGIVANSTRLAEFAYDNIMIASNVIHGSYLNDVQKLVFMGATCIYPKMAPQPLTEDSLLTGPLEPTNQSYAIAKLSGLQLCASYRRQYGCDFVTALPTSAYGEGDSFDLEGGHVLPALISRIHTAKIENAPSIRIWGSGKPLREFLHVEDLAGALLFLLENYSGEAPINIGGGTEISIADLASTIAEVVGYRGEFEFDLSKPDGTPRKLADNSKLSAMGWTARVGFREGLERTYGWFLDHHATP